ncbi:hypothetical protein BLNAU_6342 [Blattamonas nauphoetae]|uniref:PB1 domain-containing protein n=1 Tax=Blattamonas nauphoetae TaxID=2049346 RepID=A0ABQ9Y4A0_9EUKA|nr:hypothetical protein BLNAU_6342 [Blattamonas nauphoetae]
METSTTFQPQIIKITLTPTGDTRRIQLIEPPSYEELLTRIHSLFGINTSERLQLTYVDDEGDTITIANGDDVQMSLIAQAPGKRRNTDLKPGPNVKHPKVNLDGDVPMDISTINIPIAAEIIPRSEQSHQQQYSPPKTDEPKEEKPKEEPRVVPPQPEQEARAPPQNPFNFGQNMDWSGMMQQFAPLVQQFGPMLQNFVQGMNSTGQHPNPSQFPQSPHQSAPKKDDEEDDIY